MDDQPQWWNEQGWQVCCRPGSQHPLSITVNQAQLSAAQGRQLASALQHAAYNADGQLNEADWTHAMLVALLVKAGGSLKLEVEDLATDALGAPDGRHYSYSCDVTDDGTLRLAVLPAADQDK